MFWILPFTIFPFFPIFLKYSYCIIHQVRVQGVGPRMLIFPAYAVCCTCMVEISVFKKKFYSLKKYIDFR